MPQNDLERGVASATGKSLATVHRLGFGSGIVDVEADGGDPEPTAPRLVDRDALDARRGGYLPQRARWRRKPR